MLGAALRVLLGLAVALGAPPAWGLRGVVPGSTCEGAEKIESRLGSVRLGSLSAADEPIRVVHFDGSHEGHPARIAYICEAGAVVSQLINVRLAHERDATQAFSEIERALVSRLGEPSKDADEPAIARLQEKTDAQVWRLTSWVIGARSVDLMLSKGDETWEIFLRGP